jgi:hypothetical protein
MIRQTLLIPVFIGIQAVLLLGMSQGREILRPVFSESGYESQIISFVFSQLFLGLAYFSGIYWLSFFSNGKGRLYEESWIYSEASQRKLKIQAGLYHDFIQKNRGYWLRLYSGFGLFSPSLILLVAGFILPDLNLSWWISLAFLLTFNVLVLYFRKNRAFWLIGIFRSFLRKIAGLTEFIGGKIFQFLRYWFRFGIDEIQNNPAAFYPISTEQKADSFFLVSPVYRGAFFLQIFFGFVLWGIIQMLPDAFLPEIGPLAIMHLGLIFWVGLLVLIGYWNKVFAFPFTFSLVLWMLMVSYFNGDHPIRKIPETEPFRQMTKNQNAAQPSASFDNWMESRKGFKLIHADSIQVGGEGFSSRQPFCYFIIQAEGGANRSACWTAFVLDSLRKKLGQTFDRQVFAISSVSGGTVGALTFSASVFAKNPPNESLRNFFEGDYISGLTKGLFLGEPFLKLSPFYTPKLDRAQAFEKSLDLGLSENFGINPSKAVCSAFSNEEMDYKPLHLVHATQVETGNKAVLSVPTFSPFDFSQNKNLPASLATEISFSGAMHLGARFPLVSPSAAISFPDCQMRHYVDGGYYDNGAYETGYELLASIHSNSKYRHLIRPCVIIISNSYELRESFPLLFEVENSGCENRKGAHFLNEAQSILTTAAKIRSANTETHKKQLTDWMRKNFGQNQVVEFDLNASNDEVPLNWFLSKKSISHIEKRLKMEFEKNKNQPFCKNSKPIVKVEPKKEQVFSDSSSSKMPIQKGKEASPPKPLNISPKTHPGLYYFSKQKKKWKLKSEADFDVSKLKPLKKKRKKAKN